MRARVSILFQKYIVLTSCYYHNNSWVWMLMSIQLINKKNNIRDILDDTIFFFLVIYIPYNSLDFKYT